MSNERGFVPLTIDTLSIVPRLDGETLRIAMSGAVEMRDPGDALNPYWTLIDEEARRRKLKVVELDVRDLNFMNSSGILTLVRWITRCKSMPDCYRLVLRYDRNVTWQRASIPTLAKLAPNVVEPMEIDG
ncbi:MAG: hypothetical protein QOK37_2442 [Thermoanaerobaculia bacterium]|jgi:hypothetical protein|nr:hypothetical protein [Thermoanaerobaculia bacterium]